MGWGLLLEIGESIGMRRVRHLRADGREIQIRFQEQMDRIRIPHPIATWHAAHTIGRSHRRSPPVMPAFESSMVAKPTRLTLPGLCDPS